MVCYMNGVPIKHDELGHKGWYEGDQHYGQDGGPCDMMGWWEIRTVAMMVVGVYGARGDWNLSQNRLWGEIW